MILGHNFDADVSSSSNSNSIEKKSRIFIPREKSFRKRHTYQHLWLKNLKKHAVNFGTKYSTFDTKKNKLIHYRAKKVQIACDKNCRYNCSSAAFITSDFRDSLNKKFWRLGNKGEQQKFLCSFIRKMDGNKENLNTEKLISNPRTRYEYFFTFESIEYKICRTMLLKTFDISAKWLMTIRKKINKSGFLTPDERGKHTRRASKLKEETIASVKRHIILFQELKVITLDLKVLENILRKL